MLRTHGPQKTLWFLMSLQFGHGRQQRPYAAVLEADVPVSPRRAGIKFDPALGDTIILGGNFVQILPQVMRFDARQLFGQHRTDLIMAFKGLQIPCERDKITPVAVFLKQVDCRFNIAVRESLFELPEYRFNLLVGAVVKHEISSILPANCMNSVRSDAGSSSPHDL